MKFMHRKIFLTSFSVFLIYVGYGQENFRGTVIRQQYIKLAFQSPVELQGPVKMNIKRLELGRNQIPYGVLFDPFIKSLDIGMAETLFDGDLEPDEKGLLQYEDHAVRAGCSYVYWLESPSNEILAGPLCCKVRDPKVWMSQEKIEQEMDNLVNLYPGLVMKHLFGKTVKGNPIDGLLVGNLNHAILLVGNTHAGESGAELHLFTIEHILSENKDLLDTSGFIIIPVLNIDTRNRLIDGFPKNQRRNSNGVDLNRNYPADWASVNASYGVMTNDPFSGTWRGPSPASEPETQAVIEAVKTYKPKVAFDYHWNACITGGNLVAYFNKTEMAPQLNLFAKLFFDGFYGDDGVSVHKISRSPNPGTMQRYCITEQNIPAFTVEGRRYDPVLDRAAADMVTEEDLHLYQIKHYHAILNVLKYLSGTTEQEIPGNNFPSQPSHRAQRH